jgi:hypothetical protein
VQMAGRKSKPHEVESCVPTLCKERKGWGTRRVIPGQKSDSSSFASLACRNDMSWGGALGMELWRGEFLAFVGDRKSKSPPSRIGREKDGAPRWSGRADLRG